MPNTGDRVLQMSHGRIEWVGTEEVLWRYRSGNGSRPMDISLPILEIDNRLTILTGADGCFQINRDPVMEGISEWHFTSPVHNEPDLIQHSVFRVSEDTPVIRFRYELQASASRRMTGGILTQGERYAAISAAAFQNVQEIRLSDFNEVLHCYRPVEQKISEHCFSAGYRTGGPMLVMTDGLETRLIAYEHGSPATDPFLGYDLFADRGIALRPIKGNWPTDRMLLMGDPFKTPWFNIMAISGDIDVAASTWRTFVLRYLSPCRESRKPYVFYNTWANQERSKWWRGKPYLEAMNEARMLEEIDIAHRMGIEVFVLDTGWYEKTGDWEVSPERFPHGLKPIREKLDQYGMKLGLWFNPLMAAQSSRMLAVHPDCIRSWQGVLAQPQAVWETEESISLCLVSRYRDAFADRLIHLALEEGVRYFKWDAIDLYGCDAPGHFHGDAHNTAQERADCHAFELVRSMAYVVERLQAACPDVIVDFDVTEGGRAVGLGFLSVGKYFLVNNGPYFHNYDVPIDLKNENWNLFFHPGQARNRMLRMCLSLDRWLPSVLFLGHVLPDDPDENQWASLATLALGFNGIWGDLTAVSEEGIARHARVLALYRQVREEIAAADPVTAGQVGGSPEIHEKIDGHSGCGVVCLFSATAGTHVWLTEHAVAEGWRAEGNADVDVDRLSDGCARITARFDGTGACMVFFGIRQG